MFIFVSLFSRNVLSSRDLRKSRHLYVYKRFYIYITYPFICHVNLSSVLVYFLRLSYGFKIIQFIADKFTEIFSDEIASVMTGHVRQTSMTIT